MTFKIPAESPTTNKTIRFPNDIIKQIGKETQGKDCTFSAFVNAATRAALEELEKQKNK